MPEEQRQPSLKSFFHDAVGQDPFAFQAEFSEKLPNLIHIPTGLGKTAMVIVGWLWRRFGADDEVRRQTPRRLVYCLPMRVLVEQTRDNAASSIGRLQEAGRLPCVVPVYVLMGGEDEDHWDIHPEREAIIIGTQDMLLSRALNRGYAAGRSRWPLQFGLLHTDCLWIFDEIQLMGSGLATTTQLEAFRRLLPNQESEDANDGHGCRSVWMSATLRPEWLGTVNFKDRIDEQGRIDGKQTLSLSDEDHANEEVKKRWTAQKPLAKTTNAMDVKKPGPLATEIAAAHREACEKVGHGTRTIVVVNTVKRACALYDALQHELNGASTTDAASGMRARRKRNEPAAEPSGAADQPKSNLVLLHSRFRPTDRAKQVEAALADIASDGPGTIVVSTQVIEAGVDVSAATLFTELAPWASLVQRFGRCNRRGDENEHASVWWIELPAKDAEAEKVRFPYKLPDLRAAADQLANLNDVGLGSLAAHRENLGDEAQAVLFPHEHTHVIRRKDLLDLFNTTPDLAGHDIDIDRFVREVEDSDVRVFWRAWDGPKEREAPPEDEPAPRREELCPAPIGEFRNFAKKRGGQVWRWDFLDKQWEKSDTAKITPGQVFLVHADAGGYSAKTGWTPESNQRVGPVAPRSGARSETPDATDDDQLCRVGVWQTIAEHTDEVCAELDTIAGEMRLDDSQVAVLRTAARWHDWGKAHEVFVSAIPDGMPVASQTWAKAEGIWKRYGRRHFRHELASALAVLQRPHPTLSTLSDDDLNLVAYLVAAHHGKVRLSIRSLPNETRPDGDLRFARGVWDGDELPETDLGQDGDGRQIAAPKVTLSLEPMELGLCEQPPFAGQPSWSERMIRLRDTLGPFRLAYLEAILRAADMRASKAAEQHAASDQPSGANHSPVAEGAGA